MQNQRIVNEDMEIQLLGCLLKDSTLVNSTLVKASMFESIVNKVIFKTMQELVSQNKDVDKVSILNAKYDVLVDLNGLEQLTQMEFVGKVANFNTYESQLIEKYKHQTSRTLLKEILSDEEDSNVGGWIDRLQKIDELAVEDDETKNEALLYLHDLPYAEPEERDKRILSGLNSLDALTLGFSNKMSYILAGRPSMGKTATMLTFVKNALEQDVIPLIFSLETSKDSLLKRLIASIGDINMFYTKFPHEMPESKMKSWRESIAYLYDKDFEIYDKSMQTISYIRQKIRRVQIENPDKQVMVFIDYLTLLESENDDHYANDHTKVTDFSRQLKFMAQDFDCPVITLAQLSRAVEQRQDKRPMLSDLRESGSIEQDADAVMFLYRDAYYNNEEDNNVLEIIVAKQRDGATGVAEVHYNKQTQKMGDLS